MKNVVWTAPAVDDLESIRDYIARDSEVYANAMLLEIFEAVDRLESFPCSGRVVLELEDENTRELIVDNYRVIYDLSGSTIRILTVLHGARSFFDPR